MEDFSLKTCLIPGLQKNNINFRILAHEKVNPEKPVSLIVYYKYLDICRIDCESTIDTYQTYCYHVMWYSKLPSHCIIENHYARAFNLVSDIRKVIDFNFKGEGKMDECEFSLDTNLIPALRADGIRFNYDDYAISTMKITVIHKGVDICRVEAIPELHTSYSYKVSWADPSNGFCFASRYKNSIELIDNIKKTIRYLEDNKYRGGFTTWRNEYQKERDKFDIKDVIFNSPATIVLWADGTKTVVKAENEIFDPEKGLAMAIAKKALGNNYGYYDVFKKYVGKHWKKQKKG